MPQVHLNDLEKVKYQLMTSHDASSIRTVINSYTNWNLPVSELFQKFCGVLNINNELSS
jgi:hypothetical protein